LSCLASIICIEHDINKGPTSRQIKLHPGGLSSVGPGVPRTCRTNGATTNSLWVEARAGRNVEVLAKRWQIGSAMGGNILLDIMYSTLNSPGPVRIRSRKGRKAGETYCCIPKREWTSCRLRSNPRRRAQSSEPGKEVHCRRTYFLE
jgi:hypothetical protein